MAVTGAERVFSTLPADTHSTRRAFCSADFTNTKRAGVVLAWVGPNFSRSYSWRRVSSLTSPLKAL